MSTCRGGGLPTAMHSTTVACARRNPVADTLFDEIGAWIGGGIDACGWADSTQTKVVINRLLETAPNHPHPLGIASDYTSWKSLSDRTYEGRQLPVPAGPRPAQPPLADVRGYSLLRRRDPGPGRKGQDSGQHGADRMGTQAHSENCSPTTSPQHPDPGLARRSLRCSLGVRGRRRHVAPQLGAATIARGRQPGRHFLTSARPSFALCLMVLQPRRVAPAVRVSDPDG